MKATRAELVQLAAEAHRRADELKDSPDQELARRAALRAERADRAVRDLGAKELAAKDRERRRAERQREAAQASKAPAPSESEGDEKQPSEAEPEQNIAPKASPSKGKGKSKGPKGQ